MMRLEDAERSLQQQAVGLEGAASIERGVAIFESFAQEAIAAEDLEVADDMLLLETFVRDNSHFELSRQLALDTSSGEYHGMYVVSLTLEFPGLPKLGPTQVWGQASRAADFATRVRDTTQYRQLQSRTAARVYTYSGPI